MITGVSDRIEYWNSNERILGISEKMNDVGLMRGLTLSFQSMNPETLKVIERSNMKIQKFEEIIEKCDEKGIPNYTEIILGLPLETLDTWKKGINDKILNEDAIIESLISFKRAGANAIVTYFANEISDKLT